MNTEWVGGEASKAGRCTAALKEALFAAAAAALALTWQFAKVIQPPPPAEYTL